MTLRENRAVLSVPHTSDVGAPPQTHPTLFRSRIHSLTRIIGNFAIPPLRVVNCSTLGLCEHDALRTGAIVWVARALGYADGTWAGVSDLILCMYHPSQMIDPFWEQPQNTIVHDARLASTTPPVLGREAIMNVVPRRNEGHTARACPGSASDAYLVS